MYGLACYIWSRSAGQSATTSNHSATPKHVRHQTPPKKKPQLHTARWDKRKIQSPAFYHAGRTFTPLSFCCYQQKWSRLAAVVSAGSGSPRVVPLSRFKRRPVLLPHARPRPLFSYLSLGGRFNPFSERLSSESVTHGQACCIYLNDPAIAHDTQKQK